MTIYLSRRSYNLSLSLSPPSPALYYSFSVFFVELVAAFDESRSKTGWVYSSNTAVFMFSGPLGGWALSRWGTRATLNLGGLLASVGYLGSAFSPNLNYIFLFYSVLNGECQSRATHTSGREGRKELSVQ